MKVKIILILISALAMGVLLSGCATGLTPSSWPGVVSDGKVAYVASATAVYAVDMQNGNELWRFPAKADAKKTFFAAPVLTPDGQLIVGGYDHVLYSLDPQNGNIKWQYSEARDRWIGSVLVANDLIYAPNADYNLYAFNLSGAFQWKFAAHEAIWSAPITDGQRVYFGAFDRTVYALDAHSGQLAWKKPLEDAVLSSPVLTSDGKLYIATFGGNVFALDTASGNQIWQFSTGNFVWSSPVVKDGQLYIGDSSGTFYALDAATGRQVWRQQPNSPIFGTPLATSDHILFGSEAGDLYALDAKGQNAWKVSINGKLYGAPVAAGDLILVAPVEGQSLLIALDQAGVQKWSFTPAKK